VKKDFSPRALREYYATDAAGSYVACVAPSLRALRAKNKKIHATNAARNTRYERNEFLRCERCAFVAGVA